MGGKGVPKKSQTFWGNGVVEGDMDLCPGRHYYMYD